MTPRGRMTAQATPPFAAIVLAGERPGGSALARSLALPAAVLAPLGGRPSLLRVMDALTAAERVGDMVLCGPARAVVDSEPALVDLTRRPDVRWLPPAAGPAASAAAAAGAAGHYPLLLTSGDHGLLTPALLDAFAEEAWARREHADVVVGLVPHACVREAFPQSRRTVLAFAGAAFCGSNLFALLAPASGRALAFWSSVEADRKRPWRIARRLGPLALLRYLLRRLTVDDAFAMLSRASGCRIRWVSVPCARAAVDVDSTADWQLADALMKADAARAQGSGKL